jgi:serine/threonine protein kinase
MMYAPDYMPSLEPFLEGLHIGNYELLRQLCQGGYASIYLARHIFLNNLVALKLLNPSLASHDDIKRFQFEACLLAHLRHPHIVRMLGFGWEQGIPFLAMKYAPRGTLQQVLPQGTSLPLSTIVPIVMQIARALQYVHDHDLIHCDVKPENVLVGPRNQIWLCDFGIATSTSRRSVFDEYETRGTVRYMAPEQIYDKPLPASDQYALGIITYQWLCGRHPFQGSTFEMCSHHLSTPPPPLTDHCLSIPRAVERVVLKALAKAPQERFAHIQEFAFALKEASVVTRHRVPRSASRTQSPPFLLRCITAQQ